MSILRKISTVWVFLTLILPFVAARWDRRHQEVAHRARGDVVIHKRQSFSNARFTYYDVGLGACGQTNVASDWIVALTVDQFGSGYPGPECFKTITIQYGGKTAQATIMDECMGCPEGGLDFSRGLFDYFAEEREGVIYGTWWFGGDSGTPTTSTPWQQPTSSSTPEYTPPSTPAYTPPSTPAYTPPSTSSTPAYTPTSATSSTPTYIPPTTTTTSTSTSTTSSTSSSSSSTRPTSGSATSSSVPTPAKSTQNIPVINLIMIELGIMLSGAVENE